MRHSMRRTNECQHPEEETLFAKWVGCAAALALSTSRTV